MTEKTTSQSQKKTETPFGMNGAWGFETWKKLADENLARTQSMLDDLGKLEASSRQQLVKAIDDGAKLMHESVSYAAELSREWRKTTLEATQKTIELFTPSK